MKSENVSVNHMNKFFSFCMYNYMYLLVLFCHLPFVVCPLYSIWHLTFVYCYPIYVIKISLRYGIVFLFICLEWLITIFETLKLETYKIYLKEKRNNLINNDHCKKHRKTIEKVSNYPLVVL